MKHYALIDNSLEKESYLFTNPQKFIVCDSAGDVEAKFAEIEEAVDSGHYAVGWFSYEFGECFEERFASDLPAKSEFPFFCVAIFNPEDMRKIDDSLSELPCDGVSPSPQSISFTPNITKSQYIADVERIKEYLAAGDVYQVNYTFKYKIEYEGCKASLYKKLRKNQKVEYGAFLNFPNYKVLSFSPELFFKTDGDIITSKPMKGTAPKTTDTDAIPLDKDNKNLSENLMIVDLIRNDISRVAENVSVPKLFEVEEYETLYQMTSTITGNISETSNLLELFKNLYPCGSITGTPKIRAMEIISQLEKDKRKVYTGSVVCIKPNRVIVANVAIRTLLFGEAFGEMGIGSGIVYDSIPQKEYEECLLKAKFLTMSFSS